jgi:DNA-directed RNA polymerase alpha subunit
VAELVSRPLRDLMTIKNFGKKSADEINAKLAQYNLSLKQEEGDELLLVDDSDEVEE